MQGGQSACHESMSQGGPVMLRAKSHEDFSVVRKSPMRPHKDCASIAKIEMVAARVPDEFVGEAVGEHEEALVGGKA